MVNTRLKVLTLQQAEELISLLTNVRHAARITHAILTGAQITAPIPVEEWDTLLKGRALTAVYELDALLVKFQGIRNEFKQRRPTGSRGRPRSEDSHWLAEEIAEIVRSVSGVEIKYSKGGPTVFSQVLEVCFSAVDHHTTLERIAAEAAREQQPVTVDDETWAMYMSAISKKKPNRRRR